MPEGLAVSRAAADTVLVQYAIEAGVRFCPNVRAVVEPTSENTRRVRLHSECPGDLSPMGVEAGIVFAADGLGHSSLCELPEFEQQAVKDSHIGAGCTTTDFPASLQTGTIHMVIGRAGYVGLVIVESSVLNVAAALAPSLVRQEGSLANAVTAVLREGGFPAIPALADADWCGTPHLTRREPRVAAKRLFVLGDAAGYAEPFTGEGMTWAVMGACAVQPLAQRALRSWHPKMIWEWTAICRRMFGRRHLGCRALAGLLRIPLAVSGVGRLLGMSPYLASQVVKVMGRTPGTEAIKRSLGYELQDSRNGHCCSGAPDQSGGSSGTRAESYLSNRPAG